MVINQGDIYWINLGESSGPEPGFRHPFVIVQNNIFNKSRIDTVIGCSLTSNIHRAKSPGNVLLIPGEAGLSKQSVINVSQIYTIDKDDLGNKIGTLCPERILEVLEGIKKILEPRDITNSGFLKGMDAQIDMDDDRD